MNKMIVPHNEQFDIDLQIDIDIEKTRIGFITGAGVSVGSGLPTYYGKNGHYTKLSERPEDILNVHNMRYRPEKIWDAIGSITKQGLMAQPNISHKTIAKIQTLVKESQVLTQNVDNLHKKANSQNIIDIHGTGEYCYCSNCAKEFDIVRVKTTEVLPSYKEGSAPLCPKCEKPAMVPDIVAFGDEINHDKYYEIIRFYSKPVDIVFVTGTQISFGYIEAALYDAKKNNKDVIIIDINPDLTHSNPYADYIFHESCDNFFNRLKIF